MVTAALSPLRSLTAEQVAHLAKGSDLPPQVGWLVHLDAAALPEGVIASWPNKGKLAGEFGLGEETLEEPKAEEVAGRKAVTFNGRTNFLRSSIATPETLTGDRPFSAEAWVFNPGFSDAETIFAMAPQVAILTSSVVGFGAAISLVTVLLQGLPILMVR